MKNRIQLTFLFIALSHLTVFAQYFPPASALITGQGPAGSLDPVWSVSQLWYDPAPTAGDLAGAVFSPALINNSCAPGAWVDPASLAFPNNQSNWITGADVDCGNNYGWGYRAFRMTLNLPSDCNGVSVTQPGTYILNLIAFADNSIAQVYINGTATGISGGNYSPSGGVNITLSGPWLVGNNTVDIVVLNDFNNGALNPYGLLVTSNSTVLTDTDNDGVNDNDDLCPCTPGNNAQGCITNTFGCDMTLIQTNVENAQLASLAQSNTPCKLYYMDTILRTSATAQSTAASINGTLAVIDSPSLMSSLLGAMQEVNPTAQAYFGLNDITVEGNFVYPNGEPVIFTNWNAGEPNNSGDEDCVEILTNGLWNDIPCNTLRYAVYEIDLCPDVNLGPDIQVCVNTPVTVTATATDGSLSYTYDWMTGATTPAITVTPSAPMNVSVTIYDENLCNDTDNLNITLFASEPKGINSTVTSSGINANGDPIYTLCEGASIGLTAFGGSGYIWSNGVANGASFVPVLGTTMLTCHFTNIHGCQDSVKAQIQVNPLPNVNAGTDVALCFGDAYSLNATGAVSYVWSNGQANGVNYNQVLGTSQLIVTGTGANTCTKKDTILITVYALPVIGVNDATYCLGGNAVLTATGAMNYAWSPATALSGTIGASVTTTSNVSIDYTVTGTDANGCVSSDISHVVVNGTPTASINAPVAICLNDNANIIGSGGTTYEWLAPASLAGTTNPNVTQTPLVTTVYTLVAFNGTGCSDTISSTVVVNSNPTVTVNSGAMCFGTSLNLTAGGAVNYSWTPATDLSATTGTTVMATPGSTTMFTVEGTDVNGCSSIANATVTVNPLPLVDVNSAAVCSGIPATLTASGAVNYSWSPATDLSATSGATVNSSTTSTIDYTVTGTDANGCVSSAISHVTVNSLPIAGLNSPAAICLNDNANIIGSGGTTYEWLAPASLVGTTNPNVTETPLVTTVYTLVAFTVDGCSDTISNTVMVNNNPNVTVNSGAMCFGTSFALTAGGALNYVWTPATDLSATTGTTVTATPGSTAVFTVEGTDANGCSSTANATVTVNSLPNVAVNSETMCLGETSILNASGAVNYVWTPATSLSATIGSSVISSATVTTNYTVTGTDANGCIDDAVSTVTISPNPTLSIPSDQTICYGEAVELNAVSNGTVEWNTNSNNAEIVPPVGTHTYIATAVSAFGCEATAQFTVIVAPIPEANFFMYPDSLEMYSPEISFTNTSSGAVAYEWWFGDGSISSDVDPSHVYSIEPLLDHYITMAIMSEYGCFDTITKFLPKNQILVHFVPNTFTPDGDENNNVFLPILGPGYDEFSYTLSIFNRWGETLFESHDIKEGWDGTYHGQLSQVGTYLWKITVKEIGVDKAFEYHGSVTLMK